MLLNFVYFTPEYAQILALAMLVGWLIDRYLGEPKPAWHPVVWIGYYLDFCGKRITPKVADAEVSDKKHATKEFLLGAFFWLLAAVVLLGVALKFQQTISVLAWYWQGLILGILLKPLFSWRMLRDEVMAVEFALENSLDTGRQQLSRLVSRDVSQLPAREVRESAIETLAENLNDSVISPLFWFVLTGLPGVLLYRFANTADAMWGYRGERGGRVWTWAGKWAARADDILSWPGARITALLMYLVVARMPTASLWREAGVTSSPNGGWTMGAMALILNVRLSKPGVYVLHAQGAEVDSTHIRLAFKLCERAIWLWFVVASLCLFCF